MNKYVIYTVLIGGYDNVLDPLVNNELIDFICFVGKGESILHKSEVWKFVEIDSAINDNGRVSRIPKILPHKTIISDYEYSLYIDANILIKDKYIFERLFNLASSETRIALLQHPFRDCVYQEAYVCIASLKGGWLDILKQICFLKWKKIPKHNGLYEANVIFRKHNDSKIVFMDELWWKTFMNYSKRDQLSLVYAIKESNVQVSYFLTPGQTTRNHFAFEKTAHLTMKQKKQNKIKKCIINNISKVSRKILKENYGQNFHCDGSL